MRAKHALSLGLMTLLLVGCGPAGIGGVALPLLSLFFTLPTQTAEQPTLSPGVEYDLLIPVGRTLVDGASSFEILVDSEPYEPALVYDEFGGYWARVPFEAATIDVVLHITRTAEAFDPYHEPGGDVQRWLAPSDLIDSDNPTLVDKVSELVQETGTTLDKAKSIQRFVMAHLEFRHYKGHDRYSASESYEMGYGTCVNHARLFVALARAAGIPARTVWGVIYDNGAYDWHHEWAEYLDDNGAWHPLDLTFTTSLDLSDARYLDLIYAAEENPYYARLRNQTYSPDQQEFLLVDTTNPYDGHLGFEIVEADTPDRFIIENRFTIEQLPGYVPAHVP
ncbi:MAG: transglutaminase domain-containing protein [Anaerolineae bacterium]|nr:transglutaminase domain-containing protein [Anaerolineae bacterium]